MSSEHLNIKNLDFGEEALEQKGNCPDGFLSGGGVANENGDGELKPEIKKIKLSDIVFDENIYPRKEHDPLIVQKYADCMEMIEARKHYLSIASDNTLLDGRHRHLGYRKNGNGEDREISVFVYPVESEADKFALAVELNSSHGHQLSAEDKRRSVIGLYSKYQFPIEKIAKLVSVRKATALGWTKEIRDAEKQKLHESIFDMWLACFTVEEIAEETKTPAGTIKRKLSEEWFKKFPGPKRTNLSRFEDFDEEDGLRPIYNYWNFSKNTNKSSHFGNCDPRVIDNLIYLYTKPFDIVLDPFAGGGISINVCKNRLRRYWVSDRKPIVEREKEIRKLDIVRNLPPLNKRWSDVSLTFLDPPYWKQAEGQYSDDPEDLANMPLVQFNESLSEVINSIADKQSNGVIALLIEPTQWKAPNREFADHIFDMCSMVNKNKLKLVSRVTCPIIARKYNAQQVTWAKKNKELLVVSRELVIWRII